MKISDLTDDTVRSFIDPIDKSICSSPFISVKYDAVILIWESIYHSVGCSLLRMPVHRSIKDLSIKLNENNLLN